MDHDFVLVVDPIDGTRSFAAGDPVWAVSVRARPIGSGRSSASSTRRLSTKPMLPSRISGATLNGQGDCRLASMRNSTPRRGLPGLWALHSDCGMQVLILNFCREFLRWRCASQGLLQGRWMLPSFPPMRRIGDIAACDLILTEAGGRLMNLRGRQPLYNRVHTLHGELVAGPDVLLTHFRAAAGPCRHVISFGPLPVFC